MGFQRRNTLMGSSRPQTAGLAGKLRQIRAGLGLSQAEMVETLKSQKLPQPLKVYPGNLSRFEQGEREPSPLVLLAYARAAGVAVEILIDANMKLPDKLPYVPKRDDVKRKKAAKK
jgi:transcriptional regulator with XRE-family HTH domain